MSSTIVNDSPSAVADIEAHDASRKPSVPARTPNAGQRPVWIDLDNSPHVPFFRPIIKELEARGCPVLVTARDCFQVCGLAEQLQVECKPIGRHYGKHRAMKFFGLGVRTLQLLPSVFSAKPILAVSHGSRSQLVAATLMGVPTLQIVDYEFAKIWAGVRPSWVLTPDMIPDTSFSLEQGRLLKYPGIKEDVYVPSFVPQDGIRAQVGVSEQEILVTIRPPASEAHYHSPNSDKLFEATINHLAKMANVRMVVLPRTPKQGQEIYAAWPELAASRKLWIPEGVVDGLNLIWHSDLVISGGGTMNREAAALGIPVYSIFRGTIGAVDKYLAAQGRMVLLETPADLPTKLHVVSRNRTGNKNTAGQVTLNAVTGQIVRLAELGTRKQTA
jgi:predicted glycosyltransferase